MTSYAMATQRLSDLEFEEHCLCWLESRCEEELPVCMYSGGPLTRRSRYHILARQPSIVIKGSLAHGMPEDGRILVQSAQGEVLEEASFVDLLDVLRKWNRKMQEETGAVTQPRAGNEVFRSGYLGYFAYDLAWLFEYGLPRFQESSSSLPDLCLGWYPSAIVCDRQNGSIAGADEEIRAFLEGPRLAGALLEEGATRARDRVIVLENPGGFHREEYEAAVERIRQHCQRGDIFQADLSRRISLRVAGDPRALFRRLVRASPAAYSAYLGLGCGQAVLSSSPELFLQCRGGMLRTEPIKGTRPRGKTDDEDRQLARELLASEKDVAELTMIVDLMRNDLGRVAKPGSVTVTEFPSPMTLPQVHHLFAGIEAQLEEGKDFYDLLAASFPPGSISGAPKPKAIEILEMVERSRRGVYTGAIGYIDASGDAELSVAIRTVEWDCGQLRFGVGGGITVKSDPALEFEETKDKARGLALALGIQDLR